MSLSDLASLGSFVSGVAVLASLIYLAIQTNQNTRNTRALMHQGAAARTTAIRLAMMEGERAAAWVAGNGGKPTPDQVRQLQFNLQCATALDALEDHYLQHQANLVSSEQFARAKEGFRRLLLEPGMRAYWSAVRPSDRTVAPHFSDFVDSLCSEEATDYRGSV